MIGEEYHIALLMFKAIHGMAPVYICNTIYFVHDVTGRNLSSYDNMNLYTPGPNIELFKRPLAYNGPAIWNALPIEKGRAGERERGREGERERERGREGERERGREGERERGREGERERGR